MRRSDSLPSLTLYIEVLQIQALNMQCNINTTYQAQILIIVSIILSNSIAKGYNEDVINSFGIKSKVGKCKMESGQNGHRQEYCYIDNDMVPGLVSYFKDKQTETGKNCTAFKLSDFNEDSPSIMYLDASGRIGNQLLGYAMLYQLGYVKIFHNVSNLFQYS